MRTAPTVGSRLGSLRLLALLVAAISGSGFAAASQITLPTQLSGPQTLIDFNSLSTGAQASTLVISGVTFSGVSDTINTNLFGASISFPTFVSGNALGRPRAAGATPIYTITFATAMAQVGFGLFDPNFAGDLIQAFDVAGNLLESTAPDALFPPGGSGADYVGFVRNQADIKRIEITAGVQAGVLDALWVDNLSFSATPVSAPGTLLLAITGLAAAARRRRR